MNVLMHSSMHLAAAADVLSDQLRIHLLRLSRLLQPHRAQLDRRFRRALRKRSFDERQMKALSDITPGAAAQILAPGRSAADFFEQVEYSGRRLAKMNVPLGDIVGALQEYDRVLDPLLRKLLPKEYTDFGWTREQLQFCVILTLNNAFYQVREAETEAFYALFHAEMQAGNLSDLLEQFIGTLTATCQAKAARLVLLDENGRQWHAQAGGRNGGRTLSDVDPAVFDQLAEARYLEAGDSAERWLLDPHWRGRYQSYWSIPLSTQGRFAGLMQFGFATPYQWFPRELQLLDAVAERCLLAAEKRRLMEDLKAREEQVRQLGEHMLQVEEEERRRISRELHDEAGQSLLCIRLQLEMIEKAVPESLSELRGKLAETRGVTEHTIIEIRRVIAALSPAVLEQLGLAAALRQLASRLRRMHPARVRLHLPARRPRLPHEAEIITYRLVQECCNNIAKHSAASTVNISLSVADHFLELHVNDDGVGFDVEAARAKRDSYGLTGMIERVALLVGRFDIQSRINQGTSISIHLPITGKSASPKPRSTAQNARYAENSSLSHR